MKSGPIALGLSIALLGGAGAVAAQDDAPAEPTTSAEPGASAVSTTSPEPASGAELLTLCVLVASDVPADEMDAATLLGSLQADDAILEILDPDACATMSDDPDAADASPSPSPTPTATATPEPDDGGPDDGPGTSATGRARAYADFVARGIAAAIELGRLAEKYDDAEGLRALDRAAGDLKAWAKSQIRWLDRHPPRACYADEHAQWRRGAVQIRDGSKALQRAIDEPRAQAVRRATRKLTAGVQNLAGVDLDAASRDCLRLG